MSILQQIRGAFYRERTTATVLSASQKKSDTKRYLEYAEKAVSRTRQDIASWNTALSSANSDDPRNFALQLLFDEISLDALLSSQTEARTQQVLSRTFSLRNAAGEADAGQTAILKGLSAYRIITREMMGALLNGYSLTELAIRPATNPTPAAKSDVAALPIPRTNVVPKKGLFYPDYSEDKSIAYRDMPEFGTYIIEFNTGGLGLLNKAVPHVLFKRFAQSCWSELCEIYGIPPRVLKTNTQDKTMLSRAEKMMADMGAAAWFIIDETENMDWATGTATDGAVYKNLIALCSSEISLLISGAVIGQDTAHGNRSKEESSIKLRDDLTAGDLAMCAGWWNTTALPALVNLGIMKPGLTFEYDAAEDIAALWKMTHEGLPFMKVDVEWAKNKFGVEFTEERAATEAGDGSKAAGKLTAADFFA